MQRVEDHFLSEELDERWNRVCPEVDSILDRYAKLRRGNIKQWISQIPSRFLVWQSDGFDYTVSMMTNYAEPSTLTVWGAVWRDNETDLTREAVHLDQIELEGPVSKKAIVKTLVQLDRQLKAGAEVFSGNSEAFEIAKTPLVKL